MEIPGQGDLFNQEPEKPEVDSSKKSPQDETEYVPASKEAIEKAKYFLTPEDIQELRTERWLEAEKKYQRKQEEAEAMARAKELEAEEARKRLSVRKAREIRDMLAQKRANENNESSDRDSSPDSL